MNVLSLFDGMSCGQIALNRAGIEYGNYYASEIDKYAIKVTQANYPNTIQLGSVVGLQPPADIDLLIGGSPCQGFSFAGKQLAFDDPRSKLFFEWVRIWKECKPKWWLLENVKMKKEHENVISSILKTRPYRFNSAWVSAQNRERLYWTNIPVFSKPENKRILLKDIVEKEVDEKYILSGAAIERMLKTRYSKPVIEPDKTGTLNVKNNSGQLSYDAGTTLINCVSQRGRNIVNGKRKDYFGAPTEQRLEEKEDGKTNCLTSVQKDNLIIEPNNYIQWVGNGYDQDNRAWFDHGKSGTIDNKALRQKILTNVRVRRLTEIECERLQTVPDNYTNHVSSTQRYKMLGNGWTVDIIVHFFKHIPIV